MVTNYCVIFIVNSRYSSLLDHWSLSNSYQSIFHKCPQHHQDPTQLTQLLFEISFFKFTAIYLIICYSFLQFAIFSLFLSLPTLIIVIPLLFALDSGTSNTQWKGVFEMFISAFFLISESILCSHGLANSIVAIAFNSNFRRAITEHFLWNSLAGIQNSKAGKRQSIIGSNQHRPSVSLY